MTRAPGAISLGILGCALAAAPALAAPPPSRLAVVPIGAVNLTDAEVNQITASLAMSIERRYAVAAIAPGGARAECAQHRGCIAELGADSGSDKVLFLILTRVGRHVQIDGILAEVNSGHTEIRGPAELNLDRDRRTAYSLIASVLLHDLPRREPSRDRRRTWGLAVGGGGLAALAVGAGLGIAALTIADEPEGGCRGPNRPECERIAERAGRWALAADISLAVGAAAIGVSAYLLLAGGSEPGDEGLAVSASPGGISLGYTTRF
jgi:hypothetical protein